MGRRKRAVLSFFWMAQVIAFGMTMWFAAASHAAHPYRIPLRGYDGATIVAGDNVPYSPKQSCGICHDYDRITQGYHFQQGRTDGAGAIAISDAFNAAKPWVLSAGMFGKW